MLIYMNMHVKLCVCICVYFEWMSYGFYGSFIRTIIIISVTTSFIIIVII